MSQLFVNSDVIKLTDKDFNGNPESGDIAVIHPEFKKNDGYIMAFASWCPHCRAKEEYWSYLAQQFNRNPEFKNEHFRIGIIDTENPETKQICNLLAIQGIPRFFHAVSDGQRGVLSNYDGEMSLEGFLTSACEVSTTGAVCKLDRKRLNPPPIAEF